MVKKKVDSRVVGLIETGVRSGHRSLFVLVGDHGKDQVENLHKILSRCRVKARPNVLWCYKKELGFSTHRKKRIQEIKRNQARGLHDPDRDDPFDLFISSTNIRWTYYKETEKILGQTFGMCILQDFEALTPNLLARTIETVEGGGLVIVLLKTVASLKQLYTMTMDVHSRFRTEAYHEVVPRFNERFILSLGQCDRCLVLDDELNILPISSKVKHLPVSEGFGLGAGHAGDGKDFIEFSEKPELDALKASLADSPNICSLVALAKTVDQAKVVMAFLDAIAEKTLRSTVSLTAGRGRGKSAAIGLCLAGAISYGYSNIFVTAPSPENLKAVFEFVLLGLKALKYTEHMDFEVVQQNMGEEGKVIVRVNIFRDHRQTIAYILPTDHAKLAQAELVAIDEAAAIPLPTVKNLLGPYLVFMSSTISGYEGTGRALSLKLISQLRSQQGASISASAKAAGESVVGAKEKKGERKVHEERWKVAAEAAARASGVGARRLTELTLTTPIRYNSGDAVEAWLNSLLCLDATAHTTRMVNVLPAPKDCELYLVDRNALFSFHSLAESLLQRIWALYTSAHYKNSPNDLQMLSDGPAHRIFVLLGPQGSQSAALPDILCVVQVAFEGQISKQSVQSELAKGNKASGDLIPWNVSQQYNDTDFAGLSGARIVRIASHPDVQRLGYGSRAIDLLLRYFQGELSNGSIERLRVGVFGGESYIPDDEDTTQTTELGAEEVMPRKKLPPLLTVLSDRPAERLHWVGVSYGLTGQLLQFWSRKGFKVCYVRQTANDLTGEHSAIMLRELSTVGIEDAPDSGWLETFVRDYRRRLISLLSYSFKSFPTAVALTLVDPHQLLTGATSNESVYGASPLQASELLEVHMSQHDLGRLELYSRNMVDHHMIMDLLPLLAKLYFEGRIPTVHLSPLQLAILLACGLQHRDADDVMRELDLPTNQVLAFFNKTIRKISSHLRSLVEAHVAEELPSSAAISRMERKVQSMVSNQTTLAEDQGQDESDFKAKQRKLLMGHKDISQHALDVDEGKIDATLEKLSKTLKKNVIPTTVSFPSKPKSDDANSESAGKHKKRKDSSGAKGALAGEYDVDKKKKKNKHHRKSET